MEIKQVPITDVKPFPNNPRIILDSAISSVAESIKEFGWQQPIIVDTHNVVIAGHTRLKAAEKLGLTEVPVKIADNLTIDQIRQFRILDNKLSELTSWDEDVLQAELMQVDMAQFAELFNTDGVDFDGLGKYDFTVEEEETESGDTNPFGNPIIQYTIIFDNELQQEDWFEFIKTLKQHYPSDDSIASKITRFIKENTHGKI
jgi:site-specific DNA-methyltransferase (adenine-specific)